MRKPTMNRQATFQKIYECIQSSITSEQIECCERMINSVPFQLHGLAEMALVKKCCLLTTIYQETE